jgi:aspartate aminotransferase
MPQLNPLLASQPPNPMFRIGARVHGRTDVVHLEFGEPDFPTPPHIVEAAQRSLADEPQTYGPGNGMPFLREALVARVARVTRVSVAADQIVVAAGGTGALSASLLCLCTPGDEVLVPDPAWAGYDAMVPAAGARMVRYPLRPERGWQPDFDALETAISPRTRVLLINSPSNPGGALFPHETMARLVEVAQRHDLWLLSDECYDEVVFEGEHVSPASLDTTGRVVTIGTFSKTYAMTGWRIGWAVVPPPLARPMGLVVATQVNNLPLFTQRAAAAALAGSQDAAHAMVAAYRRRRDLAVELLRAHGLATSVPHGAFYLLVPVADRTPAGAAAFDGVAFAETLIERARIAVAPGAAFGPGARDYMRISLASSEDTLRAGVEGMLAFAATYSGA